MAFFVMLANLRIMQANSRLHRQRVPTVSPRRFVGLSSSNLYGLTQQACLVTTKPRAMPLSLPRSRQNLVSPPRCIFKDVNNGFRRESVADGISP